jgi:small GTP-binding protein
MSDELRPIPANTDETREAEYEASIESLRLVLEQIRQAPQEERSALREEQLRLEQMLTKLETGRVDIAVFGQVNVGKSSLINALVGDAVAESSARAGSTVGTSQHAWGTLAYSVPGFADSHVTLIDTPGLNEVAGEERARLARETAQRCDLVLFVVADDLLDVQYDELRRLGEVGRPIILVFNKSDLRSPQELDSLVDHIRSQRLPRFMSADDVVAVSANPNPVTYIRESADGATTQEVRRPPPQIEPLKVRILEVLQREGKALLAVNSAIFAADSSDKLVALKARLREQAADRLILRYAAVKGAAVALTPLPVVDVAGAALVDAKMIHALASVYGIKLTRSRVEELLKSIALSAGWVTAAELITHTLSGLLKAGTFGLSTLMTAPIQGLAAAYGSYIVGHAAKYWVEHGQGWGREGPKTVVHRILKQARAGTVVRSLKEEIEAQLKANPHAG